MEGCIGRSMLFGLLLAGLLLQTSFGKISSPNQYGNDEFTDGQPNPMSFRAGNEYVFEYNSQTASGLIEPNVNENEPHYSEIANSEKSVGRYQALAKITFITENRATLQLKQVRVGSMNNEWHTDLKRMQPMNMFEKMQLNEQFINDIQLPCDFIYNDGIVERINFHPQDAAWSKNIKRAVLSHIQLNLKRKTPGAAIEQDSSEANFPEYSNNQLKNAAKTFIVSETSLQGICQTTYTINDDSNNSNNDEQGSQFNVTKSINFKNCRKIADISFGYQPEENAKNAKCARLMENSNTNGRFAPVDDESCDPKELDHNKLDRSTVQRIQCVGRSSEKQCAIKRVETLSQYVLKNIDTKASYESMPSAMHTVVLTELIFRVVKSSPNPSKMSHFQLRDTSTNKCVDESASCSLLYDNEWEMNVKQFYIHGDEQFNAQNSPFKTVSKKAEQALQIFRHLMLSANDKQNLMEGETVAQIQRLVHLLRMCTVEELKQIQNAVKKSQHPNGQNSRADAQKAEQLFSDALAIAGTRNTVHVLIQKIYNGELSPSKAANSLKNLYNSPAPSDSIATMLSELCRNELVHRTPALEQSCWLTFGKVVSDICHSTISVKTQQQEQQPYLQQQHQRKTDNEIEGQQETIYGSQSGYNNAEICPPMKKESYKQILTKKYQQAHTMYEKILALKTIGNAGLDNIVPEIENIASGKTGDSPLIRAVSIDALRRLRWRMPRKIQRICLPIFQNVNERSEIRMTAFAALMNSLPEAPILDQILYTLSKERSHQVQSFVYSMAKVLAESQVPQNQIIAKHLKSALQLTGVSEEDVLSDSGKMEMSFYNSEEREGAIVKLISMYDDKQMMPIQLAFGIDTILNGQKNLDRFRVSLAQQNTNGWLENVIEAFLGPQQQSQQQTRASRSGASSSRRADEELRNIFSSLRVKSRQQPKSSKFAPFIMASVRVAEVDHAFVALDGSSLPHPLRQLLESGESTSIVTIIRQLAGQMAKEHLRTLSASVFNEKSAHVPTSAGVPLKIAHSMTALSAVDVNAKIQQNGQALESSSRKASLNAHVRATAVHLQKMEIWTPVTAWGILSKRSVEINAPIQLEITGANDDKEEENNSGIKVALKLPQAPKTRLFGAHSFAATYAINEKNDHRHVDAHTNNNIKMRVVRNPALARALSPLVELDNECYGGKAFDIPICVSGHFRMPTQFNNMGQWLQIAMATESHIHVSIRPTPNGPKTMNLYASGSLFKRVTSDQVSNALSQLQKFYENAEDSFHPAYPEEYQNMEVESYSDRRQKLEKTIQKMVENEKLYSFYKHALKFSVYTESNNTKRKGQIKLEAICDARFKSCSMASDLECSKCSGTTEIHAWTFKTKLQYLTPETVSSPMELQRLRHDKQQNLIVNIDAEWGTDRKQNMNFRLQGSNAQPRNINEQQELNQWSAEEIKQNQHEKQSAISFINNYECAVSYKLNPYFQSYAASLLDVVKARNFWNSESQLKQSGRDGQVYVSLIIEPTAAHQAKLQVRTPLQIVKINNLQLPTLIRPMPLIHHGEKSIHSIAQFLTRNIRDAVRDQCTVDSHRVETFDGARYKGPITSSCYSVLAKDCSNAEQPEFVVLMKSTDKNGQQKKIKVVTQEQVIECEVEQNAKDENKIECKINGELVNHVRHPTSSSFKDEQRYPNVEYNNEEQTAVIINPPSGAVSVRFACQCSNCECQKATIQLANKHKYGQCGLCGHYDDTIADEFRMSDDEQTQDLAAFHRSYTMLSDMEGKLCTKTTQENFYKANQNKFFMLNQEEWNNDQASNEDSQWQRKSYGGYATENANEERIRGYNSKKHIQPVMKTKIVEQDQRVCFSVEPVKQCSSGSVPVSSDEDSAWDSENESLVRNVQFVCMDRLDAYEHLRVIAKNGVAPNVQNDPAVIARISKDVREPVKCQRF